MSNSHLSQMLRDVNLELPSFGKVLIVDDEPDNLITLEALLEDDWDVCSAACGADTLALLQERGPVDLVIADQRMPGMSGVALLTRVAELWPDTVRVVLTGYADLEPMLAAINEGSVYRFLLKPYDPEQMRHMVADAVDLRAGTEAMKLLMGALLERKTELRRTLEELEATQQQLVAAERVATVGGFMSGVVHDLGNLGQVLVSVLPDMSGVGDLPPDLEETIRAAWDDLRGLLALLKQVMAFAHGGADTAGARVVQTRTFMATTLEIFALEELGTRCGVDLQLPDGVAELHLDPELVRQALFALLRNAFRASPAGETVVLALAPVGDHDLVVDVRDRGMGMEETTLARAMEPFFSGFDPPGLGLGLEVARLAAEAHGGGVELVPIEGGGACARLLLTGVRLGGSKP